MSSDEELCRLYDAHAGALFGYLLNLTRCEADTRDLLQSLFCQLARRPGLLHRAQDERAFLIRMAHNAAVDFVRRHQARRRHAEALKVESVGLFEPAGDPDATALRLELEAALGELPPEQRAVVHLKLWEGLTFEAIADLLGIPANTAASRYRYGIDKIRAQLRPLYSEIR